MPGYPGRVAEEERFFTLEEANAATERLRGVLARIRESRAAVVRGARVVRGRAATNGGGEEGAAYWEALRTLRRDLEELSAEGIILRDADTGLVDFPFRREGRTVYLCWRLDESRIGFWHESGAGFGGRRPI
jgi:hypothetical protein